MKRLFSERLAGASLLIPFGLAIAYLHHREHVPFDTFIFGSGSWGFAGILKLLAYHGLIRKLHHDDSSILRVSVLNGTASGIAELGVALVFFAFLKELTLQEVVAFGVGIGTIEAVLVATPSHPLKGTGLESAAGQLEATISRLGGFRRWIYGYALPYAERLIAAGIHIGTRGLVYVAYRSASPLPFAIALATFVLADGIVGYRLLHQGKLSNLKVLNRTYVALSGLALLVLASFLYFWAAGRPGALSPSLAGGGH